MNYATMIKGATRDLTIQIILSPDVQATVFDVGWSFASNCSCIDILDDSFENNLATVRVKSKDSGRVVLKAEITLTSGEIDPAFITLNINDVSC